MGRLPLNRRVIVRTIRQTAEEWAAFEADPEVIAWRQRAVIDPAWFEWLGRVALSGLTAAGLEPPKTRHSEASTPVVRERYVHLPLDPLTEAEFDRARDDMRRLAAGESVVIR